MLSAVRSFIVLAAVFLACRANASEPHPLFVRSNTVAWCIVPFDAKKRGPEDRAQMLDRLGIKKLAYDWRDEHIPTFDAEVETMQRHGIEMTAWWVVAPINDTARKIFAVIERLKIHPQIWVLVADPNGADQATRVQQAAAVLRPIVDEAKRLGCKVGLYNHGGWFGEPENQIAIIKSLAATNVGLIYNFHHGHPHIERFPELFKLMQPYLLAVNLNGMVLEGDKHDKKIMTLGSGDREYGMLRVIRDSGWNGLIGVVCHRTDTDAEVTVRENLQGLDDLASRLGKSAVWEIEDPAERARLPEYQTIPFAKLEELSPAKRKYRAADYHDWNRSHGTAAGTRFSSLAQINRRNVTNLVEAWTYHSGDGKANIQCNPIVVDGRMFLPTPGKQIVAVDAASGKELWRFKPNLEGGRAGLADDPARRGFLYWRGTRASGERLFFTGGRWIFALDPKTGKPAKGFGEDGRLRLEPAGTVAPVLFKGVLVVAGYEKDVFGFDGLTGKELWRFHTLPQAGEYGFETWSAVEEGANCWGGMVLDEGRGIAYISTGSPKPNFYGNHHLGQNLFGNCVIALDALTGKRRWHFQEIAHDVWDWDIPAPPILATVERGGKRVDVVAQVTKIGNTLVLDRMTGKTLFPFRLRRAPTSQLPGERTWPYQPDLELPQPFVRQGFQLKDVTTRTPEAHEAVMKIVGRANLGWFPPFAEAKPTVLFSVHGGAEWTGATVDPRTGYLYVSANEIPKHITVFRDDEPPRPRNEPPTAGEAVFVQHCAVCHGPDRRGLNHSPPLVGLRHRMTDADVVALLNTGRNSMPAAPQIREGDRKKLLDFLFIRDRKLPATPEDRPHYTFNGYNFLLDHEGYPGSTPPWGTLNCIDLNTGKLRWKVPLGEYAELKAAGVPQTGQESFGGAITTAGGLVFVTGTLDKKLRAFDSETGAELWAHELPLYGTAPPSTYEVNGVQYVVVVATGGGKLNGPVGDGFVAFKLLR